jgi:hypothetical protein
VAADSTPLVRARHSLQGDDGESGSKLAKERLMDWIDASILLLVGLAALAAGYWASKPIGEAVDWLSDDLGDAVRLTDEDREAVRRELLSR